MRPDRLSLWLALAVSVVLHLPLLVVVLTLGTAPTPHPRTVTVTLFRPPPPKIETPAPPKVEPTPPPPRPAPQPPIRQVEPLPQPIVKPVAPVPAPEPPKHFRAAEHDTGLGVDLGGEESGDGSKAVAAYADSVKQRIQAAKTYPPALKGMHNECVVGYRVTIDRQGQILDYQIDGCGNPFLDSAARAAILKAAPYPLPPKFAGERHDVYGSLIFRH